MLRRLTFKQLAEWQAYENIEPFGDKRADWHAASICAAVANVTLAVHKQKKRFRVSDFLLEFGDHKDVKEEVTPRQTWQEMKFIAQMQVALANAEEAKRKKRRR